MKEKKLQYDKAIDADATSMFESSVELSDRERLFVGHYVYTLDGADAAAAAGYSGDRHVLRSTAWKVLHRPNVRSVIDEYLMSVFMNIAEMKARLSAIARGSMADFIEVDDATGSVCINFIKARDKGMLGLIKKARMKEVYTKNGDRTVTTDIELYDAKDALVHISKLHGLINVQVANEETDTDSPFEMMAKAYRMENET
jgi:phage terminase small subunit